MSTVVREVDQNNLATPPALMKDEGPMGRDLNIHYTCHRTVGQHTEDCFMLRRDIEALIQKGFLKKLLAKRKRSKSSSGRNPLHHPPLVPLRDPPHSKRRNINVISGGFASGGETCDAR